MAAVLEKPAPAAKYATEVDEQLAQATSRIRVHDLAFGSVLIVAALLVYSTAMIVLDKYAVLPEWVRQLGLVSFLAAAGSIAYLTIVRPLRQRINPIYAAVQVEKTIENSKNSLAGYVEAQQNEAIHPAVKAAMGARAAKSVGEADVNHAVDHRNLVYASAVAVVFLLALIVLFFVFRPAQFRSLAARTFAPFSSEAIAARTQLTLLEPPTGDVTITAGQSVTIKVNVGGKVPSADNPDRLRVLIRHNQANAEFEELPLEKGENSREWMIRVPDYLVRNGFWYKLAGGDAETAEYKVTVRSLPLISDYEVTYEFPAYTRLKPETSKDANLRAIRGTKVTITGKTNRTVKDGKLAFDPPTRDALPGKLLAEKPDSVQFQFTLGTSGFYRPTFTSSEGERSPEPPPFKIAVDEDQAPSVEIVKPEAPEIALPANGLLAVDGAITDDHGIDKATLRMRLVEPLMRDLAGKPYQEGKSFQRPEKDGTSSWPTSLEYKDSVELSKLTDAGGQPVVLQAGMVLEFWLEATDNRTKPGASGPEPDPNLGKSAVKRVRLTPPILAMEEKKNQDAKKDQRKNEEKNHNQTQQQRLDKEPREPNQPNAPKTEDKMPPEGTNPPMPMPMDPATPPKKTEPEGTPKDTGNQPPMMPPAMPPMDVGTPMAPMASTKEDAKTRSDAQKIQDKLDEQKGSGSAKPPPSKEEDRANPAEPKPMPMSGEKPPPESGSKEPPKENDPSNPMQGSNGAESKPMGNPQKPEDPAATKPEPSPMNPMGGMPPAENKPAPKNMDPMKGAGSEKPVPQPMNPPMPMDPDKPAEDKNGGGGGKPSTQQKPEPGMEQPNPAEGSAKSKPMPGNDPGTDKPEPKPSGSQDPKSKPEEGGSAKPQSGPSPADAKPARKDENPMKGAGESDPKPMPSDMGTPSSNKPEGPKPMGGEPGSVKPSPDTKPMPGAGDQKPTPEQMKDFQDAVKDLNSKDPGKQKAAQDKLDNQVGEKNRKEIEDIQKGLNSKDPMEKAAAEQKLKDLQAKAGAGDKQPQPKEGAGNEPKAKPDPKELEGAMKDLQSPDKGTRDAAKDALDKALGKGAGDKAEQLQNDLKSEDKDKRAAAEKELKDFANQAKNNPPKKEDAPGAGGKKVDPKEVEKALDDLNSDDPNKRAEAKKKLDDQLGKGTGDKAEEFNKKANSENLKDQSEGRKGRDDLTKKAEEMAKTGEPQPKGKRKELSKEEIEQLAKKLNDLNNPDESKRKDAEKELDKQLGEEARKKLQETAKDPKKAEELKKQLDEMAKKGGAEVDPDGNIVPKGGDPTVPVREAMKVDAKNRAKSSQLQLEQFEKNKDNAQLLEDTGMTQEQYEKFLDNYRKEVAKLKKDADDLDKADPTGVKPPTQNVGQSSKIESKGGASTGTAGGPTVVAPGYGKALEEFNKGVTKTPKK